MTERFLLVRKSIAKAPNQNNSFVLSSLPCFPTLMHLLIYIILQNQSDWICYHKWTNWRSRFRSHDFDCWSCDPCCKPYCAEAAGTSGSTGVWECKAESRASKQVKHVKECLYLLPFLNRKHVFPAPTTFQMLTWELMSTFTTTATSLSFTITSSQPPGSFLTV